MKKIDVKLWQMKVALVYDRVNKIGGAERVLGVLHEIYPEAPLYTAVYNPDTAPWAKFFRVIPSFLQKIPFAATKHELYPWLTSLAFESFDFSGYDVVISVTSAEAKSIITKPGTLHVCYCLTPTRYLWSGIREYRIPFLLKPLFSHLRLIDQINSQKPDVYFAISKYVAKRIKKYYRRDCLVIYPPVDIEKWEGNESWKFNEKIKDGGYYLIVSRLVPYKKVDLVVRVFNKFGWSLKIIGMGSDLKKLKQIALPNIEFLGQLTDRELLDYYLNCKAVIFPQEEDFGLVPLEAQLCGKPVIAYGKGGALETIIKGVTGEFFFAQNEKDLENILKNFKIESYNSEQCRDQARKFSGSIFKRRFKKLIEQEWKNYLKSTYIS